jgi:predicted ester cyclase
MGGTSIKPPCSKTLPFAMRSVSKFYSATVPAVVGILPHDRPALIVEITYFARANVPPQRSVPRRTAEMFRAALPDLRVVTHDLVGERDLVAARGTLHGTQARELFGVAPTVRSVAIDRVLVARLRGGKIAELWLHYDAEGLARQLRGEKAPEGFG